jgi:hypothetical protein
VKQIKLIHQKKLTPKELTVAGNSLHQNVVDCMKALLNARKNFGMYELDEEGKKTEEDLFEWDENQRLSTEMGKRILRLFNSEAIQKTYARRRFVCGSTALSVCISSLITSFAGLFDCLIV